MWTRWPRERSRIGDSTQSLRNFLENRTLNLRGTQVRVPITRTRTHAHTAYPPHSASRFPTRNRTQQHEPVCVKDASPYSNPSPSRSRHGSRADQYQETAMTDPYEDTSVASCALVGLPNASAIESRRKRPLNVSTSCSTQTVSDWITCSARGRAKFSVLVGRECSSST